MVARKSVRRLRRSAATQAPAINTNSSRPVSGINPKRRQLPPFSESAGCVENAVAIALDNHWAASSATHQRPIRDWRMELMLRTFADRYNRISAVPIRRNAIFGVTSK